MKNAPALLAGLLLSALGNAACTFYTACPAGNDPNKPAQGGNGTGGNGTGGSSNPNNGGKSNVGGTPFDGDAPTGVFVNLGESLQKTVPAGGDVMLLAPVPNSSRLIVGVAGPGLLATDDGGETWIQLGTGSGSDVINNGPMAVTFDPDNPETFWENGIYGGAIFRTDDSGETFDWLGTLGHCDLASFDFTDPDRKTILAGAHEMSGVLNVSRDAGETWEDIGANLPPGYNFSTLPLVIDAQTFLLGSCGYGMGKCGVFRSTDGGDSWTVVSDDGPASPPLRASDGTIYWGLYEGGMIISEDLGETWKKTSPGPVRSWSVALSELPDGRILALGYDYPLVTADKGETWKRVGGKLPFPGQNCGTYGMAYMPDRREIFINHNDCTGNISDNSIWSVPFDYETE